MISHKLIAEVADRARAMRIAGALQDLLLLPPDALTVFEERPAQNGGDASAASSAAPSWRIEAYFSEPRTPDDLGAELASLLGEPAPTFEPADIPDLNWVALSQAALPPVRAGRFTVHGCHDRERVAQGPGAILIEAGEAFGTAHHATTYGCLVALDELARAHTFRNILDLGCGSGILAIAAARAWPKARILGNDIDARSVEVAADNARLNRAGARIDFVCASGVEAGPVRRAAPYDLVVANILAAPLIQLAPDVRRVAETPGGIVVLSGLLTREAPAVKSAYQAQGFALLSHRRYDGWSVLTLRSRA